MMAGTNNNGAAKPKRVKGEGKVWVCDSFCGGRFVKKMTFREKATKITPEIERRGELARQYARGFPMPVEDIPTTAWELYPDYRVNNLTDFFTVNGYFIVSERFVETVEPFDMGDCSFHPMTFYRHDRKTRMEGNYYFFNIGNHRSCFVPDRTAVGQETKGGAKKFDLPEGRPEMWSLCTHANNELAVTAEALNPPEFWIDSLLSGAFFISGPLEAALREAKLIKGLSRWRCRILDDAHGAMS